MQGGGWSWLATDLPQLRTLVLSRAGQSGYHLPAALGDCTSLQVLRFEGLGHYPPPPGPYLSRLRRLDWLACDQHEFSKTLAALTAVEELTLLFTAWEAERSIGALSTLRNLRKLTFLLHECYRSNAADINIVLSIQQHLPAVEVVCQLYEPAPVPI